MKSSDKLPWHTWVWVIAVALIAHTVIEYLRGRNPLSTYQWVAGNFMSAIDSASDGNFGPLLLFVFVGVLLLCFVFWWSYWEEKKANRIMDKTQLKEWARRKYIEDHNLDKDND